MKKTVETKKVKDLSKQEKTLINRNREREFGKVARKDFDKDYEPNALFLFVKDGRKEIILRGWMGESY